MVTDLQIQVLEAFFLALINGKSIQLFNRFFKPFDSSLVLACHGGIIPNSVAKLDDSVLLAQCTGRRNLGIKMLGNVEPALNPSLGTIRREHHILCSFQSIPNEPEACSIQRQWCLFCPDG